MSIIEFLRESKRIAHLENEYVDTILNSRASTVLLAGTVLIKYVSISLLFI